MWKWGQDQAATIKSMFGTMLPGTRVFLDVDNLDDIAKLEEYIETSEVILVLLTRDYLSSWNCRRELAAAVDAGDLAQHRTSLLHPAGGGSALSRRRGPLGWGMRRRRRRAWRCRWRGVEGWRAVGGRARGGAAPALAEEPSRRLCDRAVEPREVRQAEQTRRGGERAPAR